MALVAFLSACAHAPLNRMLTEDAVPAQLRITPRSTAPADGVCVVLFFSGGGTRAAAFSYGVLKELSNTTIQSRGQEAHRLLDDVEAIGAVSGGSFTAAYYCLYHDRIFVDYERRFLKHNVQRGLILRTLNPLQWPRLASPWFGRSDLAAEYYDRLLFNGATFGDLAKAGGRPYLAINATDMATGEHFVFSSPRFGLIASEINNYPISRAVAASSAVPLVLTPITLRNFYGMPGAASPRILPNSTPSSTPSAFQDAKVVSMLRSYMDSNKRPYIHLVDGGMADNLGMQSFMDDAIAVGGTAQLMDLGGIPRPKRLVVIVVNSAADRGEEWNSREAIPGTLTSILALGDRSGARADHQTLEAFRASLESWKRSMNGLHKGASESSDYYFVEVGFNSIKNEVERSFFLSLATAFTMPDATVDRLIKAGGEILRCSPEYQRLLKDIASR